jgi:hypothetical protein
MFEHRQRAQRVREIERRGLRVRAVQREGFEQEWFGLAGAAGVLVDVPDVADCVGEFQVVAETAINRGRGFVGRERCFSLAEIALDAAQFG